MAQFNICAILFQGYIVSARARASSKARRQEAFVDSTGDPVEDDYPIDDEEEPDEDDDLSEIEREDESDLFEYPEDSADQIEGELEILNEQFYINIS